MEKTLAKNELVPQFWLAYQKTQEYKNGAKLAVLAGHPLVEKQEKFGLTRIYSKFVFTWAESANIVRQIRDRTVADWIAEWRDMHKLLFSSILKDLGNFRTGMVYFGNVGDEQIYRIPQPRDIFRELSQLAYRVQDILAVNTVDIDTKMTNMAQIHYDFIRIHPFIDGNGRIARAITDQLALYYGLPVAMVGFPRHAPDNRNNYHMAIRACVEDPCCKLLADWIRSYIERQLDTIS